MAKAFFVKELVSNPLILNGRTVPFENFGDDAGGIETDDQELINALKQAEMRRMAGVYEVDEQQYFEQKKKATANELQRTSRSHANNADQRLLHKNHGVAAAVANRLNSPQQKETFRVPIPTTKVPVGAPLEQPTIAPAPAQPSVPKRPVTRRLSQVAPPPPQPVIPETGDVMTTP